MGFLLSYLRQKTPSAGKEMPLYYRQALSISECLLVIYFVPTCLLISWQAHRVDWAAIGLTSGVVLCLAAAEKVSVRIITWLNCLMILLWCVWHTSAFGWGYGAHLFLIPALMLIFFNIYEPAWAKLAALLIMAGCWLVLFVYSLQHQSRYAFEHDISLIYQICSDIVLLCILAVNFVLFSSSIQATERQLRLDNQQLHREAGTDPLTRLPNRRFMLDCIEKYRKENPNKTFCLAIADIDFLSGSMTPMDIIAATIR